MNTTINGISLEYEDRGRGLPVILLHAFPLNRRMWEEQLSFLGGHCRAIAVDLRGFGGSSSSEGPSQMSQMASDVRGLMSHLSIDRAALVGLSMGGYVALAFYRNYPESVCGLVLADTRATADTEEARERRLQNAERAEREGAHVIVDEMIPLLLSHRALESRPDVVRHVRSIAAQASAAAIAGALRGMAQRVDSSGLLPRIECPTLVLVGENDSPTPPKEAEVMHSLIPGSTFRLIRNAGHLSNVENPEEFNAGLLEFVNSMLF